MFILNLAMELDKCIEGGRSCRDFSSRMVPLEMIYDIMNAAVHAQSAGNVQNWAFVIVTDDSEKEDISLVSRNQKWMSNASSLIVFCNDASKCDVLFPKRGKLYATQAVAAAAQNAVLKAEDLGLATCWVGAFDEKAVQRIIAAPDNMVPEIILVVGYPMIKPKSNKLRTEIEKIAYFNTYGNTKTISSYLNIDSAIKKAKHKAKKNVDAVMKETVGKLKDFFKKK